jgi:Tfp pilus assembly protein PilF
MQVAGSSTKTRSNLTRVISSCVAGLGGTDPRPKKTAQEALGAFERALEIDPRSTDARVGIARVLVGRVTNATSSRSYNEDAVQENVARVERLLSEAIE